jgi:hypothetical protein
VTGTPVTPTPPVAAVYANTAAMFAAQGSQMTDYIYQAGTDFYRYKGTTVGDITDYVQIGGGAVSDPVDAVYADTAAMIAAQGSQLSNYFYQAGETFYRYKGTTAGTIADYVRVSVLLGGDGVDVTDPKNPTITQYPEAVTTNAIDWTKPKTFGSFASPRTGSLTESNTGAKRVVQVIFYSGASFTAPSANWKLSANSADYATSGVNIIYVEYFSDTYKRYWFDQDV